MATLYELQGEYQRLYQLAEEEELTLEDIQDTLESLDGEMEDKAVGYAMVMKDIEGQIDVIKKEVERLNSKVKTLNNNKDRMKNALQDAMIQTDNKEIKTDLFNFKIQNNPPSVKVLQESEIPEQYFIPQEPKLDKKGILAELKAGKDIQGVEMVQGQSLRIR